MVYDGVGASTFETSLTCCAARGMIVVFGMASGKVPPFDISRLTKGSKSICRPTLFDYIQTQDEFLQLAGDFFKLIESGKLAIDVSKVYPLANVGQAHSDLESRATTGKLVINCGE